MARPRIDLAARITKDGASRGADFPVRLRPLYYDADFSYEPVPGRLAVVREDTGEPLAVVSERYTLVPHRRILDAVEEAVGSLGLTDAPRGIYLDRRGARMRALFKFPSLAEPVVGDDPICPCVKIQNTYDGTSRIAVQIGAFRFVCTNLAVGGGGAFAGGFLAVHTGDIPVDEAAGELRSYLAGFGRIVALYRHWSETLLTKRRLEDLLEPLPARPADAIRETVSKKRFATVYDGYNAATGYATRRMRSARSAFALLGRINRSFQRRFPPSRN